MSYMLPHLNNGWQVDQAILAEEDRAVVIRFGHDWDPSCMRMDEVIFFILNNFNYFRLFTKLLIKLKILLLFTLLIHPKFLILIRCMNCTIQQQ